MQLSRPDASPPILSGYVRAQFALRSAIKDLDPQAPIGIVPMHKVQSARDAAQKAVDLLKPYVTDSSPFTRRNATVAIPAAEDGIALLNSVLNPPANARIDVRKYVAEAQERLEYAHTVTGWESAGA